MIRGQTASLLQITKSAFQVLSRLTGVSTPNTIGVDPPEVVQLFYVVFDLVQAELGVLLQLLQEVLINIFELAGLTIFFVASDIGDLREG